MTIAEPEKQVKSSQIQKHEKTVPEKDEVLKKDPKMDEKLTFTNELKEHKSLD